MSQLKKVQIALLVVLLSLFSFMAFYHLGNKPLLDFDEAIYAQVARQAFEQGGQLGFTWLGNIGLYRTEFWFEKPPLMLWLIQGAYGVFGVGELAARLWVAVFSVLTVGLAYLFTKKLSSSMLAGIVSVAVFFVSFQFIENTSILQFDIPVGFFNLLALYLFWVSKEKNKFYYWFWIAVGLGVMTKSVIGLLPLPIIFLYSLLARDFAYLRVKQFYYGGLAFLAVVLPWHLIESFRYGRAFWDQYLFYHLLQRYSTGLEGNGNRWGFFWDIIFKHRILFASMAVSLVYFLFRVIKSKPHLYVLTALLFVFFFFSSAKTKLPAYILPIYPLIAVMIGMSGGDIVAWLNKKQKYLGVGLVVIVSVVFVFFGLRFNQYKLSTANEQYLSDSKTVGQYLVDQYPDLPVYYYSTVGIKPSTTFYSNRVVYLLKYPSSRPDKRALLVSEIDPEFANAEVIFTTKTQKVYLLK